MIVLYCYGIHRRSYFAEYIHSHGPLSVETAIQFTEQILSGIKHAHDMRIVHRDIKPQNILIDKNKNYKFLILVLLKH